MDEQSIIGLAADIVIAHLGHNATPTTAVPMLIKVVHEALAGLGDAGAVAPKVLKPAVSIRSSVKADVIICLECGARMKMLKRHLRTDHDLTPEDYRERWQLKSDYPLVAPDYADVRKALALKIGLGRKRAAPPKFEPVGNSTKKTATAKAGPSSDKARTPSPKKVAATRKPVQADSAGGPNR